jgi:ketosteroid isomerase-like protein
VTVEGFAKAFALAFGRQDAAALTALLSEDADVLTLTGATAIGTVEAEAAFAAEFSGTFASARLVSGKLRLRPVSAECEILMQRFVVSGARDEAGQEVARFGAVLTAVLVPQDAGWRAVNLILSVTR